MSSLIEHYRNAMTQDDARFFRELGQRVASLRKEQQLTQVQLAESLGISQQHMASFENGIRKIPSSMLPKLAEVFGVTVDSLLGVTNGKRKRGPTPMLQRQMERLSRLPKAKQKVVMEMLDGVLSQAGR
jgi:transcriptional regulator with XRE-family HTH domain